MGDEAEEIRHPQPGTMVAHLIQAAEQGNWDHWNHDFSKHRRDWVEAKETRQPLTADQYARLPVALANHQHVELCTYVYQRRTVWAYYRRRLPFDSTVLSKVGVVYDPAARQIVHCMRFRKGKRYCEQYQRDGPFVKVRW